MALDNSALTLARTRVMPLLLFEYTKNVHTGIAYYITHLHYKLKDYYYNISSMDLPQMILLETGMSALARIKVRLSLPYNRQVAWDLEQFPLVARREARRDKVCMASAPHHP